MALINLTTLFGGVTPLNSANIAQTNFRGTENISAFNFEGLEPSRDKLSTNPFKDNFKTKAEIEQLAKSSPRIMALLKEYNIPLNVNVSALEKLAKGHLGDVRVLSAKIYSSLPEELKAKVNNSNLQQAAMLHDYGKVLIPKKILDKEGKLSPDEKKIMELHSEFGYELLKQQGVSEEVLNLVKYHHQKPDGSGYPAIDNNFEYGISSQILTAADKYSALTEHRCYRKAYDKEKALQILHHDVENGIISQEVFDALKKSV